MKSWPKTNAEPAASVPPFQIRIKMPIQFEAQPLILHYESLTC